MQITEVQKEIISDALEELRKLKKECTAKEEACGFQRKSCIDSDYTLIMIGLNKEQQHYRERMKWAEAELKVKNESKDIH